MMQWLTEKRPVSGLERLLALALPGALLLVGSPACRLDLLRLFGS